MKRIDINNYAPLITIITSTFNAEKDLEECIKSVISQSYTNIEYIIIDGGSTDGTLEIVKKYQNFITISLSEKDNGIYDAWNKGVELANGDWIAFLGADDIYMHDAIEKYVQELSKLDYDGLDMISSKVRLVDDKGTELRIIGKEWVWNKFRRFMCTAHVGSFHSKSFFKKYGLYNIDYKIVGDYEILLRAKHLLKAAYFDEITVNMKVGGISNLNNASIKETYKAKKRNNSVNNVLVLKYDFFKANVIFFLRKVLNRI